VSPRARILVITGVMAGLTAVAAVAFAVAQTERY